MLKVNSIQKKQKLLIFAVLLALIACVIIFSAAPIGDSAHAADLLLVNDGYGELYRAGSSEWLTVKNINWGSMDIPNAVYGVTFGLYVDGELAFDYYSTKNPKEVTTFEMCLGIAMKGKADGTYTVKCRISHKQINQTEKIYYFDTNEMTINYISTKLSYSDGKLYISDINMIGNYNFRMDVYYTDLNWHYSVPLYTFLGYSHYVSNYKITDVVYELNIPLNIDRKFYVVIGDTSVTMQGGEIPLTEAYYYSNVVDVLDTNFVPLPEPPIQEGYIFLGWYYDQAFTDPYVDGDIITEDTQLYAFMSLKAYYISYRAKGAMGETIAFDSYVADHFSELRAPDAAKVAEKLPVDKYVAGYYIDEACTIEIEIGDEVTGEIVVWLKLATKTCKVTFYANGAVYREIYVPYGAALVSSEEGAAAAAAFSSLSLSPLMMSTFDFETEILEDVTLYGVLEETTSDVTSFIKGNWRYMAGGLTLIVIVLFVVVLIRRLASGRGKRR